MLRCHTWTREKTLLGLTVHADRQVYSKAAAAVKALKFITASQQHVFPLCARLELKFLLPVCCASLLCRSGLFSFFFFFSGLNCHPLKSRERCSFTNSTLLNQHMAPSLKQSNFQPPSPFAAAAAASSSCSCSQIFSRSHFFPPKFFLAACPHTSSLPFSTAVVPVLS